MFYSLFLYLYIQIINKEGVKTNIMSLFRPRYSLKQIFVQLFIFFLLFSGIGNICAQNYGISDFVSQSVPVKNQNWEIYQDPVSGFLYFANSEGLIEYNGISTRTYTLPFKQGVRSVYVDHNGRIFTGSFEDFGIWERDQTGGLLYHSITGDIRIPKNDEIWNIFENNGSIYFQSFTTIYCYNGDNTTVIKCPSILLFMFRADDRFLVQSLGIGLFWFDGSEFRFVPHSEVFANIKIHAIIPRGHGVYWICTANDGIYIYDGRSFRYFDSEISKFLRNETCNAALSVNDSLMVFGTISKGLIFCNPDGKTGKSYNYSNGLDNNTVLSLFLDRSNGLWTGLDDGVGYISISSPVMRFVNTSGTLGTIYSVLRKDSTLYLGTNHGLYVSGIRKSGGSFSFPGLHMIPSTQGQVWKLTDAGNEILCGHNEGTFSVNDKSAGKISDVTGGYTMKSIGGYILQGTYTGLVVLARDKNGKYAFRNRVNGYIEPTRYIEPDYLGFIWAVHPQKGLDRLELNEPMDSVVNILHIDSIAGSTGKISVSQLNNQVVFMNSEYIYTFNYENKEFVPLKSLENGLGEFIRSTQIINFQKNNYWFINGNRIALFEINKEFEAKKVLEFNHEYADLPGREQQIIALDEDLILIPTRQAFTIINTEKINEAAHGYPLMIRLLEFSSVNGKNRIFTGDISEPEVPNRDNNLTVFIADPSSYGKESRDYLYRIPELGVNWYHTTLDNFSFLNLRSGTYHIQVKTADETEMAELLFTVRRPVFLSIPAILSYFLLLSAIIFLIIRTFRKSLDRHRKMIEYEVGKSRLESELDYKSYELMLTMRYLIRKTDILRQLRDKLDSLKEFSSKFPVKYVKEMEKIIDNGLDSQTEEWENVMKNLKLSQEGFFRKLKEKYPSLTPNDLRLCSYLRMNFTTKEIANLINISSRAVEIGRYRLRKKMNLGHDVNLTEFLIRESESE